jgi:hypothetical protein
MRQFPLASVLVQLPPVQASVVQDFPSSQVAAEQQTLDTQ